jgi:endonuclease/exonuclease/phosphatase family metal-dependent hydrolase
VRLSSVILLSGVCLVAFSASRCVQPASTRSGHPLSIVAYNVKSLFDAVDDGTEFREFSVSKGTWDEARYKVRLANVAAAVLAAVPAGGSPPGPDILCLEEIENEKVLEALRTGSLSAARYRYAAIAPSEDGPFSVAALSRLPILASSCHSAMTAAGRTGRDLLELELDSGDGRRLVLILCHWKSKAGGGAEATEEARREAAALARSRVEARLAADPFAEVVVCGDFNESPDEYYRIGRRYGTALMPVEEAKVGKVSGVSESDCLLVASSIASTAAEGGDAVLYSPWFETDGYSYSYHGVRERLDGFLLSPGLLDGRGLRYKSFAPASASFLMNRQGDPIAWPGSSGKPGYSDHLPILLVLESVP